MTLIEKTAEQAVTDWREQISLLWCDISTTPEHLFEIIKLWEPFVTGTIAIAGYEWPKLDIPSVVERVLPLGFKSFTDQDAVAVLKRIKSNRAVFYIASTGDDGRYLAEALRSVKSVNKHLGLPTYLFLSGKWDGELPGFDGIYELPEQKGPFWFLDSTRYFNEALEALSGYKELLYLDVDTCVCIPCMNLFRVLEQYDLALVQSPMRDAIESAIGVPESFCTMEIGVVCLRNNDRVRAFARDWLRRYEEHQDIYGDNDQASFRDCLWENDTIRWLSLAPEWGLRFDFGAWVNGFVRVLHGRIGGFSQPDPQTVADEINSTTLMRIWNHKLLPPNWTPEGG